MRSELYLELWVHMVVSSVQSWGCGLETGLGKFEKLTFRGSRAIHENRENYAPRKFGAIIMVIYIPCRCLRAFDNVKHC